MKITTKIFQVLGILGSAVPIIFFTALANLFIRSHGFFLGFFLSLLIWSLYVLCVPSHHGGNTLDPLAHWLLGVHWCTSPLIWCGAIVLNAITVFTAPWIYLASMPTHLLYRVVTMPSPGWYVIFASSLGTFYPWIIGQDAWHKPRYGQLAIYYFLKLFGIYVFFTFAYPQWVIIMNLVGSR